MSCSDPSSRDSSSPVFFIIDRSSFFDSGCKLLTKKIKFLKEGNTLDIFPLTDSNIRDRIKDGDHDQGKNGHAYDHLKESESATIVNTSDRHRNYFFLKMKRRGRKRDRPILIPEGNFWKFLGQIHVRRWSRPKAWCCCSEVYFDRIPKSHWIPRT